jgi:hypothetical protein
MNKLTKSLIPMACLLIAGIISVQAQETKTDTIPPVVEKLMSDVSILSKIKVTGLVQTQWQKADTIGSPAGAAGGDFKGLDNRFQLRRARLKAAYTGENTAIVLQLDLKDDGSVKVKEAYGAFTEPYLKTFTLSGGYMNRPVAFEVGYSSGSLESPERARVMQTLFPDEVDMGAQLTIQAPKTSPYNFIKLEAGMFNGNAIASDNDKFKDFISHLSAKKAFLNENLLLSGGVSYYNGGYANQSGKVYSITNGAYALDAGYKKNDKVKREYIGFDAQASISTGAGITTIRGEYLFGKQPGTKKSSTSPKGAMTETKDIIVRDTNGTAYTVTTAAFGSDIYLREFSGGYVMLTHRIMQSKHELVVKYDFYDPNTKLGKDEIKNIGDVKFTTLGFGWNYYLTSNFKFTAYYELVQNEKASQIKGTNGITDYSKDLKDNVLTLRLQYKF